MVLPAFGLCGLRFRVGLVLLAADRRDRGRWQPKDVSSCVRVTHVHRPLEERESVRHAAGRLTATFQSGRPPSASSRPRLPFCDLAGSVRHIQESWLFRGEPHETGNSAGGLPHFRLRRLHDRAAHCSRFLCGRTSGFRRRGDGGRPEPVRLRRQCAFEPARGGRKHHRWRGGQQPSPSTVRTADRQPGCCSIRSHARVCAPASCSCTACPAMRAT